MTISPIKIIAAIAIWIFVIIAALGGYGWRWLSQEVALPQDLMTYTVKNGASLHSVANDFQSVGTLRWPKLWVMYARFSDKTNIKAGEYAFSEKESPLSLLAKINEGVVINYQVTLVEGTRFRDFLATLHAQPKITATLEETNALDVIKEHGVDIQHLEGWFYPDTYAYVAGDTDLSILLRAYKKMRFVLSKAWLEKAENLPYESAYEALIMASIVEKETGVGYERPEIAGVFVRRLQKGMRLQTDPTVIYGMGDAYDGNIRRKDLRQPTPYNTYVIKGLPPTPIAMPGKAAIHAALNPKDGETLYFVAKGDGSHYFSKTLEEHNAAVTKYQKRRRSDYRSSPPKEASQ